MITSTKRAAVEVGVAAPTLFITTAMPKSGSNWLEAMLFSLSGVGGFDAPGPGSCGCLTLSALTRVPEAMAFIREAGLSVGDVLARLLDPALARGDALRPELLSRAEAAMAKVRSRIPPRTGLRESGVGRPPLSRLVEPLRAERADVSAFRAVGCPAKHEPAANLAEMLPGWKIVQLVRDPRDVVVSRFYHDLAHMDPAMVRLFARGEGSGVSMRTDWVEAYLGHKRDELLKYYERFEAASVREEVRCVVRYEDLLVDTPRELGRVAAFVGLAPMNEELVATAERFAFDKVAAEGAQVDATSGERRNSFLRKGKAGDWRTYFDRRVAAVLGPAFAGLLVRLGYEQDDRWVGSLPEVAPRAWDFSRLRARASLARSFRSVWDADAALQERYPDPTDVLVAGGSFVDHLVRSGDAAVLRHRATLVELARLWGSDIKETVAF